MTGKKIEKDSMVKAPPACSSSFFAAATRISGLTFFAERNVNFRPFVGLEEATQKHVIPANMAVNSQRFTPAMTALAANVQAKLAAEADSAVQFNRR